MVELEKYSLAELKNIAKENNVKNISKLKKDELIQILKQILSSNNNDKKEFENQETQDTENLIGYKLTNPDDKIVEGILDILPDGYGFLRGDNFLSTPKDIYISPVQVKRFRLDSGDMVKGIARFKEDEKFPSLIFVGEVNGEHPEKALKRRKFDELTPIYPTEKLKLETTSNEYAMRIIDLISPIWKRTERNDSCST